MFFLILFGYITINVTKNVDGNTFKKEEVVVDDTANECSTCGGNVNEEKIIEEEDNFIIYDFDESEVSDVTESVLGSNSNVCRESANLIDKVRRLCKESSAPINHLESLGAFLKSGGGDTVDVSKITGFKLVRVTYPLAFWLGKYTMANSNREITVDDPAYSSNGQQIDVKYQTKTLSPQQAQEALGQVQGTEREPFDVTGKLQVAGAEEVQENTDGKYTVNNAEHDPVCGCPVEVSNSDFNVGTSNYIGSRAGGYDRFQIPKGDPYGNEIGEECISRDDIEEITIGRLEGCRKLVSYFKGLFTKSFSANQWQKCTVEGLEKCTTNPDTGETVCETERGDCIDTRDLTVLMSPIFGEVYNCEEDECANAFLTYAYKGTLSPEQAASKKEVGATNEDSLMYFVSTPCEAEIDIAGGKSKIIEVKCLWDATPTLMNYRLQAKDKAPNQENFPKTFDEYWNGVEVAIEDSAIKYKLPN